MKCEKVILNNYEEYYNTHNEYIYTTRRDEHVIFKCSRYLKIDLDLVVSFALGLLKFLVKILRNFLEIGILTSTDFTSAYI